VHRYRTGCARAISDAAAATRSGVGVAVRVAAGHDGGADHVPQSCAVGRRRCSVRVGCRLDGDTVIVMTHHRAMTDRTSCCSRGGTRSTPRGVAAAVHRVLSVIVKSCDYWVLADKYTTFRGSYYYNKIRCCSGIASCSVPSAPVPAAGIPIFSKENKNNNFTFKNIDSKILYGF